MAREIAGRVALVTGAARGIGRATAEALAAAGARVVVADRDPEAATSCARALSGPGRSVDAVTLDVTDGEAFVACVADVTWRLGPVGLLVNNAGVMSVGAFLEQAPALDDRQIDVNLRGVIAGMRAVLPGMLAQRSGQVVNVASVAGRVGTPHAAVYSATKHAVVGLSEAVRHELRGSGVEVSWVLPGIVRTELVAGVPPLRWPRTVSPEEVAVAVVDAVRTGRVETWVPRETRLAAVLPALLPRPVVEWVGRALGVDRLFSRVDAVARAAYDARLRR